MENKLKLAAFMAAALCFSASGSDMAKGYTFIPNDTVTHTKLNNLVDAGTISTGFYTSKEATTTGDDADVLLLYRGSAGGYRQITLQHLLLQATNQVTDKTELFDPQSADEWVILDRTDNVLKRVSLGNAVYYSTNLISARTNWTAPNPTTTFLLAYDGSDTNYTWSKLSPSNIVDVVLNPGSTNAPPDPQAVDLLATWDKSATNYSFTAISNLFAWVPASTAVSNEDSVILLSPAAEGEKATMKSVGMSNIVSTVITNLILTFTTDELPVAVSNAVSHTLPGMPQSVRWVMVCKTNDLGYIAGEEIPIDQLYFDNDGVISRNAYEWATTNMIHLKLRTATGCALNRRTDNEVRGVEEANWKLKGYATYYP